MAKISKQLEVQDRHIISNELNNLSRLSLWTFDLIVYPFFGSEQLQNVF